MHMMNCPHCGAANSVKREYCYQCDGDLQGQPTKTADLEYIPTCGNCSYAGFFPPVGHRIGPDQVWCTQKDEPMASTQMAADCYVEAFGWKREDILD